MMKYQLGEFVRFVDEKREGYITKIISEEMVGVTGDDDFEIPVMVSNLTRVHGHASNQNNSIDNTAKVSNPESENFIEKGIFLAAVSDTNKGSIIHFYVVNETSYQLSVGLIVSSNEKNKGEFFGQLAGEKSVKVFSASLAEIDIWPSFNFQLLYFTAANKPMVKPLEFTIKFKGKDFAGSKQNIALMKLNGWLFRMDEPKLVIDAQKLKESFFKPNVEQPKVVKPPKEVDLHIEKLRDDYQFLNKSEILDIQLEHFNQSLAAALVHNFDSIVFIHGVGNGTLQHKIHQIVSKHPQVKTYMDAQKEKFGYGATKLFFK